MKPVRFILSFKDENPFIALLYFEKPDRFKNSKKINLIA